MGTDNIIGRRVFHTEMVDPVCLEENPTGAAIVIDDQSVTVTADPHERIDELAIWRKGKPVVSIGVAVTCLPSEVRKQLFGWWQRRFSERKADVKALIHHATGSALNVDYPGFDWKTHIVVYGVAQNRLYETERFVAYPTQGGHVFPRHTWSWVRSKDEMAHAVRSIAGATTLLEAHQAAHAVFLPREPTTIGWATWTCPHEDIAGVVKIFDSLPAADKANNRELTWALSQPCGPPEETTRREVAVALSQKPDEFPPTDLPRIVAELI